MENVRPHELPGWVAAIALVCALVVTHPPSVTTAAELQDRTAAAFDAYAADAERAFLVRVQNARVSPPRGGRSLEAGPAMEDGVITVPGGLVHHWRGVMIVSAGSLTKAIALSQAYDDYDEIYQTVVSSTLLEQHGDMTRASLRLRSGEAGITAVVQVRATIRHFTGADGSVYSVSRSDEIREVADAGGRGERLLPPGRDSGYLWRAHTFSWLVPRAQGLYMEIETLGLSRRFPPMLGWLIEPIARRLGRKSTEGSLRDFAAALSRN